MEHIQNLKLSEDGLDHKRLKCTITTDVHSTFSSVNGNKQKFNFLIDKRYNGLKSLMIKSTITSSGGGSTTEGDQYFGIYLFNKVRLVTKNGLQLQLLDMNYQTNRMDELSGSGQFKFLTDLTVAPTLTSPSSAVVYTPLFFWFSEIGYNNGEYLPIRQLEELYLECEYNPNVFGTPSNVSINFQLVQTFMDIPQELDKRPKEILGYDIFEEAVVPVTSSSTTSLTVPLRCPYDIFSLQLSVLDTTNINGVEEITNLRLKIGENVVFDNDPKLLFDFLNEKFGNIDNTNISYFYGTKYERTEVMKNTFITFSKGMGVQSFLTLTFGSSATARNYYIFSEHLTKFKVEDDGTIVRNYNSYQLKNKY